MPYCPHTFHVRVNKTHSPRKGGVGRRGREDCPVAICVRRILMITISISGATKPTLNNKPWLSLYCRHQRHVAIMLGFLISGLSKDKGQSGVSILHMAALETGFCCWWAMARGWRFSIFWQRRPKTKTKATKTLYEKLEDMPMSYLQWGVNLI